MSAPLDALPRNIMRRADGRLFVRVWQHGREHRFAVTSVRQGEKVRDKIRTEMHEKRFFPERYHRRDVLLKDHLPVYIETYVAGHQRDTLHPTQYVKRWTEALGNKALRAITADDIQKYVRQREHAGKANATINRELAFLKRVFTLAVEAGLADQNPVKRVKLLRENNQRIRFLTTDEEQRLREALAEHTEALVLLDVALHTGFRQAELFKLRWEYVNFQTGVLTIPRAKHGERRHVPMNDVVRARLSALPSRLKSPWVFPSATGETPIDSQNFLNRTFRPALETATIPDFRWHDLRHTFASRLVMAGVDLRTVQELLGHKTLAMTVRYSHLAPTHTLAAVQKLASAPPAGLVANRDRDENRDQRVRGVNELAARSRKPKRTQ